MKTIKLFLLKILKRLKIIKYFNFQLSNTLNKVELKIPFINGIGLSNFVLKTDWLDSLINQMIKTDNFAFIDVGANIGQTLLRVKTLRPKIKYIGFEPNSDCISYIKQLIISNSLLNCNIYNCALFSKINFCVLEKSRIDDVRASIITSFRPDFFLFKDNVIAIDYDSFFLDQNASIIKIDAEGSELDVISGMKKSIIKYQPIIVCEVLDSHHPSVFNFVQSRATVLSNMLIALNYSIIQLETCIKEHRITSFKKINTIQIEQWTTKSLELNDYLFYPILIEQKVLANLSEICALKH